MQRLKDIALFIKEIILHPKRMGSAWPSSKQLAQKIAAEIPACAAGLVIELGAGTGAITKALIKSSIPPQNIIIIEKSLALVNHLRLRFPQLTILWGDAQDLVTMLKNYPTPICAVVSSLPLRSLPRSVVNNIEQALCHLLNKQAVLIQFTYDLRKHAPDLLPHFTKIKSIYVWRNLPPAKIDVYKKAMQQDVQPPQAQNQ